MRSVNGLFVLALFVLGASACRIGSDPRRSPTATSPYGARVEIKFEGIGRIPDSAYGSPVLGELLAITESGLMVDDGALIMLFRFGSFSEAELKNAPGVKALIGVPPPVERLQEARLFARYPFGLTDGQLASLLQERGQESLVIR